MLENPLYPNKNVSSNFGRNNSSRRRSKVFQLWICQLKRQLFLNFLVTSVTTAMHLKRAWSNTKGWNMENPSWTLSCHPLLFSLLRACCSPLATVAQSQNLSPCLLFLTGGSAGKVKNSSSVNYVKLSSTPAENRRITTLMCTDCQTFRVFLVFGLYICQLQVLQWFKQWLHLCDFKQDGFFLCVTPPSLK